ncbi:MAG TPA: hypothetical protein VND89_09935 [Acidimicrobiales bacterium]|nr:hypothetical protein [Acidimicrobiales bacterium]
MTDASVGANIIVRSAFLKIDPEITLRGVDTLDLRAHAKVSAVVGVPLRQLQQRRDVTAFATTAPIVAVKSLLELLAHEPLEKIIDALGEHAETPTHEQMAAAVDEILASGSTTDDVVAVLAFAVGESFAAAPHCRRLFEERLELALPELPDVIAPSVLAPAREVNPEIREQRRVRREEEKRRRKSNSPSRPPRPTKMKGGSPVRPEVSGASPTVGTPPVVEERRRLLFTPLEQARFDVRHPLVGVVLVLDVPFDAKDPALPDVTSKNRPVLVVAASSDELLVRPLYSNSAPTRTVFKPWRRLGLDHVSYIEDSRVVISGVRFDELQQLGQLTTPEWNAQTN